jgi:hypothetical protein
MRLLKVINLFTFLLVLLDCCVYEARVLDRVSNDIFRLCVENGFCLNPQL